MPKSSTRRPPSILDSILAETPTGTVTDEELVQGIESNFTTIPGGYLIPIERVEPWERQPRRFFDEEQLAMLARSIADASSSPAIGACSPVADCIAAVTRPREGRSRFCHLSCAKSLRTRLLPTP